VAGRDVEHNVQDNAVAEEEELAVELELELEPMEPPRL